MMSHTHLYIGMTAALAVSTATTPEMCAVALAGGALGGVLADIDTLRDDYQHDALFGQIMAWSLMLVLGLLDIFWFGKNIYQFMLENAITSIIGCVALIILCILGYKSQHRTFTHSALALLLFSASAYAIYPHLGIACLCGYLSHLILDVLNKKEIPLLFPMKKGVCLKLCYANKAGNTIMMCVGFAASFVLLFYKLSLIVQ